MHKLFLMKNSLELDKRLPTCRVYYEKFFCSHPKIRLNDSQEYSMNMIEIQMVVQHEGWGLRWFLNKVKSN